MPFACYSGATQEVETDPDRLGRLRYMEPFFDQNGTICLDRSIKWVFLGLLFMLQILSIVWFTMILKVALCVLKGESANDSRSGDEDEDDEEEEEVEEKHEYIHTNGHSNGKAIPSSSAKAKSTGSEPPTRQAGLFQGTGLIRVPGSRDRKALIGRVGCNG